MKFFPTNVYKIKNLDGIISNYPCKYWMECEDPSHPKIYAIRMSENSEFIITNDKDDYTKYGPHHLATLTANFWGTGFDLLDSGLQFTKN